MLLSNIIVSLPVVVSDRPKAGSQPIEVLNPQRTLSGKVSYALTESCHADPIANGDASARYVVGQPDARSRQRKVAACTP
jgi:hypothetical protein